MLVMTWAGWRRERLIHHVFGLMVDAVDYLVQQLAIVQIVWVRIKLRLQRSNSST